MVGVLTLFGEIDLQPVLKKVFMQNDLIFISENCNTPTNSESPPQDNQKGSVIPYQTFQ